MSERRDGSAGGAHASRFPRTSSGRWRSFHWRMPAARTKTAGPGWISTKATNAYPQQSLIRFPLFIERGNDVVEKLNPTKHRAAIVVVDGHDARDGATVPRDYELFVV